MVIVDPNVLLELTTSIITTHTFAFHQQMSPRHTIFPYFARKYTLIRAAVNQQQFYTPARATDMHTSTMNTSAKTIFTFGTIPVLKPQKNLFDLLNAFSFMHQHNPLPALK